MKIGAGVVKWTKEELEKLDRQTQKIMTMNGALHPKPDVDRLYVGRQVEKDCKVYQKPSGHSKIALDGKLKTAKSNY